MLEEFDKYTSNYDLDNHDIKLKYNHSYRVMELQEKYAKRLKWNKEDIEIAKIIGLLHDIGRFEQLKVYNTYNDLESIDHADYSIVQLFDKGLIKRFCTKEEWYPIIKFAIKNHNKHKIEKCNDERIIKHTQLIRDTDKVDIIYLFGTLHELELKNDNSKLSASVKRYLNKHVTADRKYIKTNTDQQASKIAFAYDIYNDIVLKDYKKYLKEFIKPLKENKELLEVYNDIIKYIDERIDNYERTRKKI